MEKSIFIPKSEHEDDNLIYQRLIKHLSGPSKFKLKILEEERDVNIAGDDVNRLEFLLNVDYIIPIISIDLLTNDKIMHGLERARNANKKFIFVLGRPCDFEETPLLDDNTLILPDRETFLLSNKTTGVDDNQLTIVTRMMKNIITEFKGVTISKNSKFIWMALLCLILGLLLSTYIYLDSNDASLAFLTFSMFFIIGFTSFLLYKNFSFTINLSFGK